MKDIVAVLMAYGANPGITNYKRDLPYRLPPPSLVVRSIPLFYNWYFTIIPFTDSHNKEIQEKQLTTHTYTQQSYPKCTHTILYTITMTIAHLLSLFYIA